MARGLIWGSSLKASQTLSENLNLSIETAKPILDRLDAWCASIVAPKPVWAAVHRNVADREGYNALPTTVYIAYATLVAYVWRALLRPIVHSNPPPIILDSDVEQAVEDSWDIPLETFRSESFIPNLPDLSEILLPVANSVDDTDAQVRELHQSALTWAASLVNLTKQLSQVNFGEFWYSCELLRRARTSK